MRLVYADHRISPFEGSPRAGAAEYVQRGGMLYENDIETSNKYRSTNNQ